ncbi:MAG: DMT family protein [Deltaproteobacteria bacterium]|nr:DMT family protein [Deltaproteobacteria bacterium]
MKRRRSLFVLKPVVLLFFSNLFMTFAWYGHLKNLNSKPLFLVIVISWGIAFFEYVLQVPANRLGFVHYSLGQLKIMQEVITMIVFAGFAVLYMKQPLKLDFLWASLCMVGAVYFMFRGGLPQNG